MMEKLQVFAAALYLGCCCWNCAAGQDDGAPTSVPYTRPGSCSEADENAVYLSWNLSCAACDSYSLPRLDGLSCGCWGNATREAGDVSTISPSCTPCPNNQVLSEDGLYCVECEAPLLTFDPSNGSCSQCPSNLHVYLDTPPSLAGFPGNRSCVGCPPGTWADQSGFSCTECGLSNCSECQDPQNGICFPFPIPSPPSSSSSSSSSSSPQPSSFYTQNLANAAGFCRRGNQEACQLLVNLCVLRRYLKTDPACVEVMSISSSSSSSPLLRSPYFPSRREEDILKQSSFSDRLPTSNSGGVNRLPLVVATFSLNGSFLGLFNVSEQLLICRDFPVAAVTVGVWYRVNCFVGVASLSLSEPVFLDLCTTIDWRDRSNILHPLPVLPSDYLDGEGEEVNAGDGGNEGAWQLVTRFFLSEAISSAPRYARDLTLSIQLDSSGSVLTPYLRINYREWNPDPDTTDMLSAEFSVVYSQGVSAFNIGVSICVVVMAIGAGLVCGLRVNGYLRQNGCTHSDMAFLVEEFCDVFSSALFILLSVTCTVLLILFKGQTTLVYVLPPDDQITIFHLFLSLALFLRLIKVCLMIWSRRRSRVFFIDWEKPGGGGGQPATNQITEQPKKEVGVVSIWRTYFVANEWNELQTLRRGLRPLATLFIVLLILQVIGLTHLAERDLSGHVTRSPWRYSAPHSSLLRFALSSIVFSALAVTVRMYLTLFHERFISDPLQQFIDLCSVSNVSVFIVGHGCYGYYIEGRSVHGRADTDMREMNTNLIKEQEDRCGRRGLMPDSDLQTFQMVLTPQFRTHYYEILEPGNKDTPGRDQPRPPRFQHRMSEAQITAYERMNTFLSSFISHNIRELDYIVKSKVFLERLLNFELQRLGEHSVFYEDASSSFSRLIFHGQEWSLWQLEFLVFVYVDLLAADYVVAAVVTGFAAWLASYVREWLGRQTLAHKTLIDPRFLI